MSGRIGKATTGAERTPPAEAPVDTRTVALHDRIEAQAKALWEGYGRPAGRDEAIWLEAERQVLGADHAVVAEDSGAVSAPEFKAATTPKNPPAEARVGGKRRSR